MTMSEKKEGQIKSLRKKGLHRLAIRRQKEKLISFYKSKEATKISKLRQRMKKSLTILKIQRDNTTTTIINKSTAVVIKRVTISIISKQPNPPR